MGGGATNLRVTVAGALGIDRSCIGRVSENASNRGAIPSIPLEWCGNVVSLKVLGKTSTSHPFGNQRTFLLGDIFTNLQEQLSMRILAHGPIEKFDLAADLGELVDQQHLVNVIARDDREP